MNTTRLFIGLALIVIGISVFTGIPFVQFLFALLIVFIGVRILIGAPLWSSTETPSSSSSDILNEVIIFGPLNQSIISENFQGGRITVVFGGGELDLRKAKLATPTVPLEVTVIFGGLKLLVSSEWRTVSHGSAILGGFNNTAKEGIGSVLEVSGTAIFGGVDIKN